MTMFLIMCVVLLVGAVLLFTQRYRSKRLMLLGGIIAAVGVIGMMASSFMGM